LFDTRIISFCFLSCILFYVVCAFVICLIKYLLTYLLIYDQDGDNLTHMVFALKFSTNRFICLEFTITKNFTLHRIQDQDLKEMSTSFLLMKTSGRGQNVKVFYFYFGCITWNFLVICAEVRTMWS